MVGAEEAVSESVHLASAVAATAILVGRAPVSDYLVALRSSGPMAFAMCQILSTQTVAALTHAGRLGGDPAKCRLLSFLAELALSVGPLVGRRITMPIRWWEVAQLVAVTPWHLSRLLRECRREGSLEMGRGWLIIRRDAALVSGMES